MFKFSRIGNDLRSKRKKLIIFISTGDTCRAPMASGYFKKLLKDKDINHIEVRDAGIMTVSGLKATAESIQVLDTVDVDLRKHNSRKLSNEAIKRADLILGMSSFHVQTALRQTDYAKDKTVLLKEFIHWEQKNVQISDPMGGTLEVYKKCFLEIKEACDRLLVHPFVVEGAPIPSLEVPPLEDIDGAVEEEEGDMEETSATEIKKPAPKSKKKEPEKIVASASPKGAAPKKEASTKATPAKAASVAKAPAPPKAAAPAKAKESAKPAKDNGKPAVGAKAPVPAKAPTPAKAAAEKKAPKSVKPEAKAAPAPAPDKPKKPSAPKKK